LLLNEERRTRALVAKLEHFSKLSAEEKEVLENAISRVEQYAAGEDIVREGQRPESVHLLVAGWAGRYKVVDGSRCIMAYMIPGDLCDIQITLLSRMDHSIGALSACTVATIPRERITSIRDNQKHLDRALSWSTLVDEAILREWLVSLALRPARKRVAHLICEMLIRSRTVGLNEENSFHLPLTQIQIADTMGMTAIHMNRVLQRLRRTGAIIFDSHRMRILDFDRLAIEAEFDPTYLHLEKLPLRRGSAN
jgi:CRP-like cAMP-binding protein